MPLAKGPAAGSTTPGLAGHAGASGELKGLLYPGRPQVPGGSEPARDPVDRRRERSAREGLRRRERLPYEGLRVLRRRRESRRRRGSSENRFKGERSRPPKSAPFSGEAGERPRSPRRRGESVPGRLGAGDPPMLLDGPGAGATTAEVRPRKLTPPPGGARRAGERRRREEPRDNEPERLDIMVQKRGVGSRRGVGLTTKVEFQVWLGPLIGGG